MVLHRPCPFRCHLARLGLLALAASAILISRAAALNDDSARPSAEAMSGWGRLARSVPPVAGTFVESDWRINTELAGTQRELLRRRRVRFWISESSAKLTIDWYDPKDHWQMQSLYGLNPQYAFIAERSTEDAPYHLRDFGRESDSIQRIRELIESHGLGDIEASFHAEQDVRSLPELFRSSNLTLQSCSRVQSGGRDLFQVEFTDPPSERVAKHDPALRYGRVILDPAFDWRVVSQNVHTDKWKETEELEYGPEVSKPATIKTLTYRSVWPTAQEIRVIEFSPPSYDAITESEFTLSSIGLPEIPSPGRQRASRLLIIGGNLVVLGIILGWLYRRRQRKRA